MIKSWRDDCVGTGWEGEAADKGEQLVPVPNSARVTQASPAVCFSTGLIGSAENKRISSEPYPLQRMEWKHSVGSRER